MRKKRDYEQTCYCNAYKFPHMFGGGRCDGSHICEEQFYIGNEVCDNCNLNPHGSCEVLDGIEEAHHCPFVIEYVEYEGIRFYKMIRGRK